MSVLPAGQSLSRFLPDLEDLLHDPRTFLGREPLTIGPRQMYGLAFLFGFAGMALLLSSFLLGPDEGERLALGIGLLLGGGIWLGWSLLMRGHALVLRPDGVEVNYHDTTVWCPWALFNVDGHAFVPDADSPRVGLTLPVAVEAIPYIELRRDDTPIAHGAAVKARQLLFLAANTVVLPARYEVMAGELGELLLLLGRRLVRELPKGVPPQEAYETTPLDDLPAEPDEQGWITVPLTRLTFPAQCCSCGESTPQSMRFLIGSRSETFLSVLVPANQPLELAIPVCPTCRQHIRTRQHQGGLRGLVLGALLVTLLALALTLGANGNDASLLLVVGLHALAVGGLGGFILGTLFSKRLPAEVAGYSPSRGTLSLRFHHPEYAARVLAAMRAKQNSEF
jgi:hypothetical protein